MKSTVTLFFILFTLTLSAQYQKGNWYLAGSTQMDYQRSIGEGTPKFSTFSVTSFRTGFFFTDRLLIGANIGFSATTDQSVEGLDTRFLLNPFGRFYFPGTERRKVNYFAEIGFGTFTFFEGNNVFETDFNFGGGAEVSFFPGVLGTATLRYNANASGLNSTNLTFGLNVLTGQLANKPSSIPLQRGTIVVDAKVGELAYGRMSSGGEVDQFTNIKFSPRVGYFILNRLMIEGGADVNFSNRQDEIGSTSGATLAREISQTQASLEVNARYYPNTNGRLLPYLTIGTGVSIWKAKVSGNQGSNELDLKSATWQAGFGTSYFLSPNLALDGAMLFNASNLQLDPFRIASNREFKNLTFKAGFKFYLPNK